MKLKIWFTDFWPGFDVQSNFFTNLLSQSYKLELSPQSPDVLIYSTFGTDFLNFECLKIFYSGECIAPHFSECDYALSFEYLQNPRHYRMPLYLMYGYEDILRSKPPFEQFQKQKTRFCNFVFSNGKCKKRNEFFKKLSQYKQVDSGGRFWNNIGGPVDDKLEFLSHYKFTIAFENESHPGYTTEKILEPMKAQSLPLYWGNPIVGREFNTQSFLNLHDYRSEEDFILKIIELDQNATLYKAYYEQPYLNNNQIPQGLAQEDILKFLSQSLKQGRILKKQTSFHKAQSLYRYKMFSKYRKAKQLLQSKI